VIINPKMSVALKFVDWMPVEQTTEADKGPPKVVRRPFETGPLTSAKQ
jgi:hypothetical protein